MTRRTLAVMQPYLFPYIGYFNLLSCCSEFILYDDVNYIKQGWINRNRILSANGEITFSVPLSNQSSNSLINEVKVLNFERFKKKFEIKIEQCYAKSKYFESGMIYVDEVLGSNFSSIGELASNSIKVAVKKLGINCVLYNSSKDFPNTKGMGRSQRLISMANDTRCSSYVNTMSGSFLYNRECFLNHGVELKFLKPKILPYKQFNSKEFVAGLSVIDMMMNLSVDEIRAHLNSYELV